MKMRLEIWGSAMSGKEGIRLFVPVARLAPVLGAGPAARRFRPPMGAAREPHIPRLGIAMITFRRDLLATLPRVERMVRPFDF